MKKISLILVFAISLLSIILTGCGNINDRYQSPKGKVYTDYTEYTIEVMNSLKPPITLIGKYKSLGCCGVTLMDSTKKIVLFENGSSLANSIGETHKIGDTIVK